jgi:hypothetical protein
MFLFWFFFIRFFRNADDSTKWRKATQVAIICAKQFSGRGITEAKSPEPGGESIWSAAG